MFLKEEKLLKALDARHGNLTIPSNAQLPSPQGSKGVGSILSQHIAVRLDN
jgi:hypothetical protein